MSGTGLLKRGAGALALIVGITGASLGLAPAAQAATPTVASNVALRPCVDLGNANCAEVGTTGTGGALKMRCWRDASWATGNYSSNRWFLMALNDGREGYVHSSFVNNQTRTPNCNELSYVRAADWAIAHIGQVTQPNGAGWSGYCATFTHDAFAQGAGIGYVAANAIDQYYAYSRAGMIYGGLPRYGEPVFYNIAAPEGHTAIYIGGSTVVTTQGDEGANLPIARRDLHSYANYLGWARVE